MFCIDDRSLLVGNFVIVDFISARLWTVSGTVCLSLSIAQSNCIALAWVLDNTALVVKVGGVDVVIVVEEGEVVFNIGIIISVFNHIVGCT